MEEQLLPEEQMQIEVEARNAFLFAAEYGNPGIDHLMAVIADLKVRMNEAEIETGK
ncbi:MAG: hypothetical protein LBR65_01290 [Culturomica sp.]|jgi:hypothetical protein|nr:hypothetical protein [Culturomica sp.]